MRTSIRRPQAGEPIEDAPQAEETALSDPPGTKIPAEADQAVPAAPRRSCPSWPRGELHLVARLIDEDR